MKKFLIFLILFTSVFVVGNVKAAYYGDTSQVNLSDYDENFELPNLNNTNYGDYKNNYDRAYQYYLDYCKDNYDSYIIVGGGTGLGGVGYGDNQVDLACFNSSENNWTPSVVANWSSRTSEIIGFSYNISDNGEIFTFYDDNEFTKTTHSVSFGFSYKYINNEFIVNDSTPKIAFSNNIDIYYNGRNLTGNYITSIIYKDVTYNQGDLVYKKGVVPSSVPTITISKTENTEKIDDTELVTSVDLNVKFSIIDNEKYIYRYKVLPSENWKTMTLSKNDNFDIHITSNTSVVVEVLDLETKKNISSATYVVSSISDIDVSISITKKEDLNCIANYNNTQVETCVNLDISFSYINFDKYYYQYSIDNGNNYINIKSDNVKDNIFNYILNNEYLIVRVIDKTTKVEKAINTYAFSKFQETSKEPYINFEIYYNFTLCDSTETICNDLKLISKEKYDELVNDNLIIVKNVSATLGIKIYNFNENYHYYYSDNSGTYKEFTKNDLKLSEYGYYYTAIETDFNIQITIDIYDQNNNYLSSYTYTISGIIENTEEMSLEKMLEHIKSIFKNDNNIFDYFTAMYNKVRDSKIGPFIYFVIISSIVLLIINALQR